MPLPPLDAPAGVKLAALAPFMTLTAIAVLKEVGAIGLMRPRWLFGSSERTLSVAAAALAVGVFTAYSVFGVGKM